MSRSTLVAVLAVSAVTSALVLSHQGADAVGEDVTAPTLEVHADWLVGSQLSPSNLFDDPINQCAANDYSDVTYRVSWTASDPSGISDSNIWGTYQGELPDFKGWDQDGPSFTDHLNEYDGDCGGASNVPDGWAITAYDTAGNGKYVEAKRLNGVIQENNTSATSVFGTTIAYSGTWQGSKCTCASGGRQIYTSTLGATATITTNRTRVGLVMSKGPGRGRADITVDGAKVATIDTYAATTQNRIIVWTRDLGSGSHTVQIKNLATSGHPRIDLDAVLV